MPHAHLRISLLFTLSALFAGGSTATAQAPTPYRQWQHSGVCWLLTTKDGADLPAAAAVTDFPVLVRLRRPLFDFSAAQPHGEDLRVADSDGRPLHFQIEAWDAVTGTASVWVRVPAIAGDSRQALHLYWGNGAAASESDGATVFGDFNGYVSTLHLDASLQDAVGTVHLQDEGTSPVAGMIGAARHCNGDSGIFGGDDITAFPSGADASSTEAWFRAERPNTTVVAWGKEQRPGKVMMNLLSPPHMAIQCYFADVVGKSPVAMGQWLHVVHTYQRGDSRIYLNGVLDGASTPLLDIPKTVRLHIGGWHGHGFVGDVDEVRISKVARTPEWIRLEYENQKPLQTLVGTLVTAGDAFATSVRELTVPEGQTVEVTAQAGGAQKVYWLLARGGQQTVAAVDQFEFSVAAGRVTGDQAMTLRFLAVYPQTTRAIDIPIAVREDVPEPEFTLAAPRQWDGRTPLAIAPQVTNLPAMQAKSAGALQYSWRVDGIAVVQHVEPGKLVLERAQASGAMTVTLALDNGGAPSTRSVTVQVTEPASEPWLAQPIGGDERPEDNQFFARDDTGMGQLVCKGTLASAADAVFVRLTAEGKPYADRSAPLAKDRSYALTVPLQPGLVHYKCEFGSRSGGRDTVLHTADNLVCGDVYLIDGQSNAEATDVGEQDPPYRSDWIRSFGCVSDDAEAARTPLWGNACVRERERGRLQIGYWGVELGKRLVAAQQLPVCIFNGAVGGTRIDVHQRNAADPEDVTTIYGRLLWRVRHAKLTHGVRAVLWHQGENDQGADGPTGRFGWETYRDYFVAMAAGWRRDYPNFQHAYVFQIWPKACAMGVDGSDDMLREVQRTLPRWFAHMSAMSTLGITPPGGCHYPLAGWAEFARLICPLIQRDIYGVVPTASITPPDLLRARFADERRDRVALEFDQPVVWAAALADQFYLDGVACKGAVGNVAGNVLTVALGAPTDARTITYLDSRHWREQDVLRGSNGIAALTFCKVPLTAAGAR